jgi:geranylgeranyl diphosphate synthase type II
MIAYDETYRQYKALLEVELKRYFAGDSLPDHSVRDAMAYSLLGGGKRVRGVMLLAFYRLFAEDVRPALPFAAALEMVHAYSLIHDDLPCMDDDDTRRGQPACHIKFGEATALLAGDGLLTLAFFAMCGAHGVPAQKIRECVALIAWAAGETGMILGQALDLAGEHKTLTKEELDLLNLYKTGALFSVAAKMGCVLGDATQTLIDTAGDYAQNLALAFQLVDDILDETADPALLGKPVGSDRAQGKNTYAALFGIDECKARVDALTGAAVDALAPFGDKADFLRALADKLSTRNM